MIKVLFILPGIDGGGVGEIVYTYIANIDKTNFCCDVASLDTPDGHIPFAYDRFKADANALFLLDRNSYKKRFWQLNEIYKSKKYDIVHVHMDNISALYLIQAWMHGVKVRIAHSHIAFKPEFGSTEWKKSLVNPLLKIFTTHRYGCGQMACKNLWGNVKNSIVMTNAIDVSKFQYRKEVADFKRDELGLNNIAHVCGTIGRFQKQKNPFFIIDIIEMLSKIRSDFVFLWVGAGELQAEVKKKAEEKEIDKHILFLGQRNDVSQLLSILDVFILPSLYEGLPIVGVESQAASVYSLFSSTITKEIGITDYAEFLEIKNPMQWASRISDIFNMHHKKRTDSMDNSIYNIHNAVKILENNYIEYCRK